MSKGGGRRIAVALRLSVVGLFIIYTCFLFIHLTWIDDAMSEGGCQSHTVTLACVMLEPQRVSYRR